MKRSIFQIYVKQSDKAAEFYRRAFDARLVASYPNPDGTLMHGELDIHGQILALSEAEYTHSDTGNTMQLCLHFGKGGEAAVQKAYDVLREGAEILFPLAKRL